jgi:hypothetical protein
VRRWRNRFFTLGVGILGAVMLLGVDAAPAWAPPPPSGPPPGLIVGVVAGNQQAVISWETDDPFGFNNGWPAQTIQVAVSTHKGCTVSAGQNSCTVTGLVNGKQYKVKARTLYTAYSGYHLTVPHLRRTHWSPVVAFTPPFASIPLPDACSIMPVICLPIP